MRHHYTTKIKYQSPIKKGKYDKNRLKHTEKIEKMKKIKNEPKQANLYKIKNRKYDIPIIKKLGLTNKTEFDDNKDFIKYILPIFIKQNSYIFNKLNNHKRKSSFKIGRLGLKREKVKFVIEKSPSRYAVGECVVCLTDKNMTYDNVIKCTNVVHVLCEDCKNKMKINICPLCKSHPIIPTIKNDSIYLYNTTTNYMVDSDDMYNYMSMSLSHRSLTPWGLNLQTIVDT